MLCKASSCIRYANFSSNILPTMQPNYFVSNIFFTSSRHKINKTLEKKVAARHQKPNKEACVRTAAALSALCFNLAAKIIHIKVNSEPNIKFKLRR